MDQEDASSMISSPKLRMRNTGAATETSDSNETIYAHHMHHPNKRARVETKFKGVVPQQNGHWGAQIYANHQRIWLGTFKSEAVAAMAYDSAAIKLRSGDTHRNFPWTPLTLQEPCFQNLYSIEAVLNMIKDGSYPSKFADFVMKAQAQAQAQTPKSNSRIDLSLAQNVKVHAGGDDSTGSQFMCKQLFQKELTPSDVGKLNRLVIPKKYAVKYFPYICENLDDNMVLDDIELVFYDKLMKSWKFRYCYWRSSQSFVFTRGWNRFVKEKNLKANDVVTFYTCDSNSDRGGTGGDDRGDQAFCLIDVTHNHHHNNNNNPNANHPIKNNCLVEEEENRLNGIDFGNKLAPADHILHCKYKDAVPVSNEEEKGFRLFGVRIN